MEKHLQRNKLSRSVCAGLPFVCQVREIVIYVASVNTCNTGYGIVCFGEPDEKLSEVASVDWHGQAALCPSKALDKLL